MNVIEEIFKKSENGTLTFEQFQEHANGMKFADISKGDYVSKAKYDNELASKDSQIQTLNDTISKRDTDLADLKTKLETAGNDAEKLGQVTADLTALQTKYDADVKDYQAKLAKQSYEFAVNNIANEKKFTSSAAKRDFIHSLIDKNLDVKDGKIVGVEDFITQYSTDNADAFIVEKDDKDNQNNDDQNKDKPKFAGPSSDPAKKDPEQSNMFGFNFVGVR